MQVIRIYSPNIADKVLARPKGATPYIISHDAPSLKEFLHELA